MFVWYITLLLTLLPVITTGYFFSSEEDDVIEPSTTNGNNDETTSAAARQGLQLVGYTALSSWNNAACRCRETGMRLLMIKNDVDRHVIETLITTKPWNKTRFNDLWFGLYDPGLGEHVNYTWHDGSSLGAYTRWYTYYEPKEPNNQKHDFCIYLDYSIPTEHTIRHLWWKTTNCGLMYSFVCQRTIDCWWDEKKRHTISVRNTTATKIIQVSKTGLTELECKDYCLNTIQQVRYLCWAATYKNRKCTAYFSNNLFARDDTSSYKIGWKSVSTLYFLNRFKVSLDDSYSTSDAMSSIPKDDCLDPISKKTTTSTSTAIQTTTGYPQSTTYIHTTEPQTTEPQTTEPETTEPETTELETTEQQTTEQQTTESQTTEQQTTEQQTTEEQTTEPHMTTQVTPSTESSTLVFETTSDLKEETTVIVTTESPATPWTSEATTEIANTEVISSTATTAALTVDTTSTDTSTAETTSSNNVEVITTSESITTESDAETTTSNDDITTTTVHETETTHDNAVTSSNAGQDTTINVDDSTPSKPIVTSPTPSTTHESTSTFTTGESALSTETSEEMSTERTLDSTYEITSESTHDTTPVVSSPASDSTATNATNQLKVCRCSCVVNKSAEEQQQEVEEIIQKLTVIKNTTFAFKRKFISISDPRPSAKAVGGIGIAVFVIIVLVLIGLDMTNIVEVVDNILKEKVPDVISVNQRKTVYYQTHISNSVTITRPSIPKDFQSSTTEFTRPRIREIPQQINQEVSLQRIREINKQKCSEDPLPRIKEIPREKCPEIPLPERSVIQGQVYPLSSSGRGGSLAPVNRLNTEGETPVHPLSSSGRGGSLPPVNRLNTEGETPKHEIKVLNRQRPNGHFPKSTGEIPGFILQRHLHGKGNRRNSVSPAP